MTDKCKYGNVLQACTKMFAIMVDMYKWTFSQIKNTY